jgi:hypothetical protein
VHDYFDILGLAPQARSLEIADACRRRLATPHPDVHEGTAAAAAPADGGPVVVASDGEVALEFASMGPMVSRMREAFFRDRS